MANTNLNINAILDKSIPYSKLADNVITTITGTTVNKANQLATARTLWGQSFSGAANVSGAISSTGNITPSANAASSLGSSTLKYKEVHISNTVNVGSSAIQYNATTGCMEIIC